MEKIYKDIIGYEGFYKITSDGEIFKLPRIKKTKTGNDFLTPETKLKINTNCHYYPSVVLMKNGIQKTFLMHRLMAIHFIPNNNLFRLEVNHKNKNVSDFSLNNLEWCTRSENMKHAKKK